MLDNQMIDPFSGVQEDLALAYDSPYDRIYQRRQAGDPLAIPAGPHGGPGSQAVRASVLSGLAALLVTVALFAGGIAALIAPTPALAIPAHVILL